MEIGDIRARGSYQLAHEISRQIIELANEHPDYPIVVLAGECANPGDEAWLYCTCVSVRIEELLDCESEWWNNDYICDDREEFEEVAQDIIWDKLIGEHGRKPTDEEFEAAWEAVKKAHEPYWRKVIAICADN